MEKLSVSVRWPLDKEDEALVLAMVNACAHRNGLHLLPSGGVMFVMADVIPRFGAEVEHCEQYAEQPVRRAHHQLSEHEKIVEDVTALSRAFGFCIPASVERLKEQASQGKKMEKAGKPTYEELSAALAAAIERRASVEQALYEMGSGKKPLPDAAECKRLARKLGMPKEG